MKIEFEVTAMELQEIVNALNSRFVLGAYPGSALRDICRGWLQRKKEEEEEKKRNGN